MPISLDGPQSRHDVYDVSGNWRQRLPPIPRERTAGGRVSRKSLSPGAYYLIGDIFGLLAGVGLQVAQYTGIPGAAPSTALDAAFHYFAGSASAIVLTISMLIFFVSGYLYNRAWNGGRSPNSGLTRTADFVSSVGALGLGIGLLALGEPLLALSSGLLHAVGKFGSAMQRPQQYRIVRWPKSWPDFHRTLVFASRVPAVVAALIDINKGLPLVGTGRHWTELVAAAVLLACYLLWAKADLLLFAADRHA